MGRRRHVEHLGNVFSLPLTPATTSTLVTGFGASTENAAGWQNAADGLVGSLTAADVTSRNTAHQSWWQSYVEILEQGGREELVPLYLLGSTARLSPLHDAETPSARTTDDARQIDGRKVHPPIP
ncbi:hypothetical protein [Nonomuraea sediminis]|uniref:hypothetical protein n=1 Tax=Nonomuraea sediminis TaxID=2835864 RepID=UPI001BDC7298|nr:hypothetical protein [Nonomuraea sediminis]